MRQAECHASYSASLVEAAQRVERSFAGIADTGLVQRIAVSKDRTMFGGHTTRNSDNQRKANNSPPDAV